MFALSAARFCLESSARPRHARFPGNLPKKHCSTPPRSALRAQTAQCCEPWFADVTHDAYVEFLHSCLLLLRRNRAARKPAVVRVLLRERARLPRERARG